MGDAEVVLIMKTLDHQQHFDLIAYLKVVKGNDICWYLRLAKYFSFPILVEIHSADPQVVDWGIGIRGTWVLLPCQLLHFLSRVRGGLNLSPQPDCDALNNDLCFLKPAVCCCREMHVHSWAGKTLVVAISWKTLELEEPQELKSV